MNTREKMLRLRSKAAEKRHKRRMVKSDYIKERLLAEANFYDDIADDLQELLILRQHEEERTAI